MDEGGAGATLALLGDVDGDLEFFHELFDDVPGSDGLTYADGLTPPSPSIRTSPRRRHRGLITNNSGGGREDDVVMPAAWEKLAKKLKRERSAAEEENARLRKLAQAYTQTTQRMWKLTQKATLLASREILVLHCAALAMPYIGPRVDLVRITRDLDALALGADDDLSSPDHAPPNADACDVENRILQTAAGQVLESTVEMAWLLPFEVDSITRVLLANSIRLVTRKTQRNVQTMYEDSTLKVVHAVSAAKEKNGRRTTKHGQLATRLEPARDDGSQLLTIATRGGFATDSGMALTIEGGGYIHVSLVPGHDSASLGPLSRVHWYRRIRAQPTAASEMAHAERARWIHGITIEKERKAERQVEKIAQAIENLLLAGSLR